MSARYRAGIARSHRTWGQRVPGKLAGVPARAERRRYHRAEPDDLLQWAREDDKEAFDVLIEVHHLVDIDALCHSIVRRPADADDAVQETLTAAWRGLSGFEGRGGATLSTWLYRVAINATNGLYRKRTETPMEIREEHLQSSASELGEAVVVGESLRWALAQLRPEDRSAVILADYHRLPYSQIAEIQIVSQNTVKSRVRRSRLALMHLLEDPAA